ncbi:hypothetical protein [Nocardiopsis suaedae]|uniref:Uncharacterized protein n=1 Tax=Nocardiopsis suaedae TaxID=3018444 RepID=A0ABT4TXG7_9ACTN|nr:hypothetical protein [Nocardiopsis suaedae]MDA2808969.1 hypothetical protein [Nocardiopsis suaedae]
MTRPVRITDPAPGTVRLDPASDDEVRLILAPGVHPVLRLGRHDRADLQYDYLQRLMRQLGAARRLVHSPEPLSHPATGIGEG